MVCIKEIFRIGRAYKFPRPPNCLKEGCGSSRIWKHGFVYAYFEGYDTALCLRRYICADCGCVYTIRPFGYWPRHHVPVRIIFNRLCHRVKHSVGQGAIYTSEAGQLDEGVSAQHQDIFGMSFGGDVNEGFYELLHASVIPVIRTI